MKKQNAPQHDKRPQKPNWNQQEVEHLKQFKAWIHHLGL